MIVDDSRWKFEENHSTIVDYHAPFGQAFYFWLLYNILKGLGPFRGGKKYYFKNNIAYYKKTKHRLKSFEKRSWDFYSRG